MSLAISNASLFLGQELDYVEHGFIEVRNGRITAAGAGDFPGSKRNVLDGSGFLIVPAFVNAHTHIADSIGKDIASSANLDSRVHPVFGAKKKILQSPPEYLKSFIHASALSMIKKGVAAFADFREGGIDGIALLRSAIDGLAIRCVALGRIDYYRSKPDDKEGLPVEAKQGIRKVLDVSEGLGISGANENSDITLKQYRDLAGQKKKLVAVHAAESSQTCEFSLSTTGRTEVERLLDNLRPDFIVHMTRATDSEIESVAKAGIGIVACPRANGVLGVGLPRISTMVERGCLVALGTDNVMLNSPDMFREMDYAWKATRAFEGSMIEAREILKMATVNGAKVLGLDSGWIEPGRRADLLFIDKNHLDLAPVHDPFAAVVHRASQDSLRGVMINGEFAVTLN